MTKKQSMLLLFFLSLIFCGLTVYFLPKIPDRLCIGTVYSRAAMCSEPKNFIDFTYNQFLQAHTEQAPELNASVENLSEEAVEKTVTQEITATSEQKTSLYGVALKNESGIETDLNALCEGFLPPKKNTSAPQILIIHTHATESFLGTDNRSLNSSENMVEIGNVFTKELEENGFSVLHDTTYHDYPNYNGSYVNSLKTVEAYLEKYPSIEIIFDLHRDGIVQNDGTKVKLTTNYNGQEIAQLMFVVGTNACGLEHPNWRENLKFASMLQAEVNSLCPTLMRPVNLRKERFNQHKCKNYIIVECGTNGNEISEVKESVKILAKAVKNYIK